MNQTQDNSDVIYRGVESDVDDDRREVSIQTKENLLLFKVVINLILEYSQVNIIS